VFIKGVSVDFSPFIFFFVRHPLSSRTWESQLKSKPYVVFGFFFCFFLGRGIVSQICFFWGASVLFDTVFESPFCVRGQCRGFFLVLLFRSLELLSGAAQTRFFFSFCCEKICPFSHLPSLSRDWSFFPPLSSCVFLSLFSPLKRSSRVFLFPGESLG